MQSFDELLRVSAGLGAILTLLDLQADAAIDCIGLHSLLTPLRQQLDASVNRIDELFWEPMAGRHPLSRQRRVLFMAEQSCVLTSA